MLQGLDGGEVCEQHLSKANDGKRVGKGLGFGGPLRIWAGGEVREL